MHMAVTAEALPKRIRKTLDAFDPAEPGKRNGILVGGGALVLALASRGVKWTHPTIAKGRAIDVDVLEPEDEVTYYRENWYGQFPEVKRIELGYGDPDDDTSGVTFRLNSKGRKRGLLEFSAFYRDEKFPEWNFDTITQDPFASKMIGNVRVMNPEMVLLWKAEHGRDNDRKVIESILEANTNQNFLGEDVVRRLVMFTNGEPEQPPLFTR